MTSNNQTTSLQEAVANGIVLDILLFFTTKHGTSESHTADMVRNQYAHIENIDALIERMINLQLLVEPLKYDNTNLQNPAKKTGKLRLSHDTLAPVIILEFEASGKAGQMTRKLLEQKLQLSSEHDRMLLNRRELNIIRTGKNGMRVLSKEEEQLIVESESLLKKNKNQSWTIGILSLLVIIILGGFWIKKTIDSNKTELSLKAVNLGLISQEKFKKGLFDEAYILALATHQLLNNKNSTILLKAASINYANQKIEDLDPLYNNLKLLSGDRFHFSPDSQFVQTYFRSSEKKDSSSFLYRINQGPILQFPNLNGKKGEFSTKKDLLLLKSDDTDSIRLYDFNRKNEHLRLLHTLYGTSGEFSPKSKYVLTTKRDNFDTQKNFHSFLYHTNSSLGEKKIDLLRGKYGNFSSDEAYIITKHHPAVQSQLYHISEDHRLIDIGLMEGVDGSFTKGNKYLRLYDENKNKAYVYGVDYKKHEWSETVVEPTEIENTFFFAKYGADESHLITFNQNGTLDSVTLKYGKSIGFSPNGQFALICDSEKVTHLYKIAPNKKPELLQPIIGRYKSFSHDNKYFLIQKGYRQYCVFKICKNGKFVNAGCVKSRKIEFFPNSNLILSYSDGFDISTLYQVEEETDTLQKKKNFEAINIRFSKDGKFALCIQKDNNHVILHSFVDSTQINIYHPNAAKNISFIGENGLILSNAKDKSVMVWPKNPLSIPLDDLTGQIQIDSALLHKLQKEYDFEL